MPKTFTDLVRHALNGPTMGTRWAALFHAPADFDAAPLERALASAVDEIDCQMSTWKPESDLNRLKAAPVGKAVELPAHLINVLETGLEIGRLSGGAFDISLGDMVEAWGFSQAEADPEQMVRCRNRKRLPAWETLEIDRSRGTAIKHAESRYDLNGIAKGYGVDRLAETFASFGLGGGLFSIDGELRALGSRPDGSGWPVGIEKPRYDRREVQSVIEISDCSLATSGDYRHWVDIGGKRHSHTMDGRLGLPVGGEVSSVTVVAPRCVLSDGLATALLVLGEDRGCSLARSLGVSALFMSREGSASGCGMFSGGNASA